jgi:hypothetical protein
MIDMNAVFEASPMVRIELCPSLRSIAVVFKRDIDADVLAELRSLKVHGINVFEHESGRKVTISSQILNVHELAEQVARSLERDHGMEVQRINVIEINKVLSSFRS